MIVCSCTIVTDRDIERALIEILSQPDAPIPTPGVVYRHLSKQMDCCSCAPVAVATIYTIVERLEREGRVCPCACNTARSRLVAVQERQRAKDEARRKFPAESRAAGDRSMALAIAVES